MKSIPSLFCYFGWGMDEHVDDLRVSQSYFACRISESLTG
jgi:hypothetical protein